MKRLACAVFCILCAGSVISPVYGQGNKKPSSGVFSSGNVIGKISDKTSDIKARLRNTENRKIISAWVSGSDWKTAGHNATDAWTAESLASSSESNYVSFSLTLSGEIITLEGEEGEAKEYYSVTRIETSSYWIEGESSLIPVGYSAEYTAKSDFDPSGEPSSWTIMRTEDGTIVQEEHGPSSLLIGMTPELAAARYVAEAESISTQQKARKDFVVVGVLNLTSGKITSPDGADEVQTLYVPAGKPFTIRANRDPKETTAWPDGNPTFSVDSQSISTASSGTVKTSSSVTIDSTTFNLTWNDDKDAVTFEQQEDESDTEDYFGIFPVTAKCGTSEKTMNVAVCGIDLRVDSNNDGTIDDEDDKIEDDEDVPGKIMGVNNSDKDNDWIPDFADGFGAGSGCNAANSKRTALDNFTTDFVELQVSIPDFITITDETSVKFMYSFSNPRDLREKRMDKEKNGLRTKIDGNYEEIYQYSPASGHFRIWKLPEGSERSAKSIVEAPSNGCIASGTEISAAELGLSDSVRTVTLYLESVRGAYRSPIEVQLSFKPDGSDSEITVSDTVFVTAVDPQMYVDGNWDGEMKADDPRDRRLDDFWINDDSDKKAKSYMAGDFSDVIGYYAEEDQKGGPPNCDDEKINCLRDLEDFKVLKVSSGTGSELPSSLRNQIQVSIRTLQEDGIRLFSFESDEGILTYLTDISVGESLIEKDSTVDPSNIVFQDNEDVRLFLFEARNTVQAVVMELKYNDVVIAKDVINMNVSKSSAYVKVNMIHPSDSSLATPYVFTYPQIRFKEEKDLILFVHGMNMGGEDGTEVRSWAETIHKRLKHMGFCGTVAVVKWDDKGFTAYNNSEFNAWKSGATLSKFIVALENKGFNVNILAHSQGNVVAGQALRILPNGTVKTYIATQAAISGHCYGSMKNPVVDGKEVELDNLISDGPDIYLYYHSGKKDGYGIPPRSDLPYLRDVSQKTNMINYYNLKDNALFFWKVNNHLKYIKPSLYHIDRETGEYYYRDIQTGQKKLLVADHRLDGDKDDRFEIFSYVAYSHSHALGVGEIIGKNNFNLEKKIFKNHPNKCEEESSHLYHSWQFLQSFPETKEYWLQFIKDVSKKGKAFRIRNEYFFEHIK